LNVEGLQSKLGNNDFLNLLRVGTNIVSSGGHLVGVVRLQAKATGFSFWLV
jgi:hypothetical protein